MRKAKLVLSSSSITVTVSPRKDSAGDYRVRVTRYGVRVPAEDYFTPYWDDALDTASMIWSHRDGNRCECPFTDNGDSTAHAADACRGTCGLTSYHRNGSILRLCLNCTLPGDVDASNHDDFRGTDALYASAFGTRS